MALHLLTSNDIDRPAAASSVARWILEKVGNRGNANIEEISRIVVVAKDGGLTRVIGGCGYDPGDGCASCSQFNASFDAISTDRDWSSGIN